MNKDVRFGLKSSQTRSFVNRPKSRSKTPTKAPVSARMPAQRKNPKDRTDTRIGGGTHSDSTMTLKAAQRGREAKIGANKKNPIMSSAEEETEQPAISYNYNPFRNQKTKLRQKSTSRYEEVDDQEGQSEEPHYAHFDERGLPHDHADGMEIHPLSTEPIQLREVGIAPQGYGQITNVLETEPTFYPYPQFHDQRGYIPEDSDEGFPRQVEPRYKQFGRNKPKPEELPLQRKKPKREIAKARAQSKPKFQQGAEQEQYGGFYPARSTTSAANYNSGAGDEWGTGSNQYSSNSGTQQGAMSQQDMFRMMAPMFNQMMQEFVNKSRSTSPIGANSHSPAPASYSNVYQRQRSNSPLSYSQIHTPNPQKYPSRPSSYNNTMYSGFDQTPQASRQDVEDLKSQTALLSSQLSQFQKIIEDLKISVSEKDVEIFRLNLALGDEKKRSQNLSSQLRDPYLKSSRRNLDSFMDTPFGGGAGVASQHNLLSDDYVENEAAGLGHSRTHSIHGHGGVTSSHSNYAQGQARKIETQSTEVQTELDLYEEAVRAREFQEAGEGYGKQSLDGLQRELNQLRAQLQQQRETTEKERQAYDQQIEAERNANTENIEMLENRANELSAEHSRYLESMRKQREQWADERKKYELDLREKGKTIGEMQRKIDKHSVDVQKAVKIHKANKELAESNLKLKSDIKVAREKWEKRGADQQSKIQYLEDSLSSLKTSLRTSESRVCNNCAVHLQERDKLEETFQAKKREIEAKKMLHDRQQDQLLVQQNEYQDKLKNQPKELEQKMAELEQKVEDERNQKLELEEQIKLTSRDISEKDQTLVRIDHQLVTVEQEFGKYEKRDKENQSVIDQVMERVAQANKLVEEQRATNKRLKQQLARDASNIVEMTTKEAELETQISNLSQELQGLEGLMPKKKH